MIKITASIEFWGELFQPGRAEALTGLLFTEKTEVGGTEKRGPYRNKPTPYGAASFAPPAEIEAQNRVLWLAQQWAGKMDLVRQCGAEDIHFYVVYYYDIQCNCALSAEEIRAINALSISYWFTVEQRDNLDEIP